jgi:hypothetical protein
MLTGITDDNQRRRQRPQTAFDVRFKRFWQSIYGLFRRDPLYSSPSSSNSNSNYFYHQPPSQPPLHSHPQPLSSTNLGIGYEDENEVFWAAEEASKAAHLQSSISERMRREEEEMYVRSQPGSQRPPLSPILQNNKPNNGSRSTNQNQNNNDLISL